MKFKTIFIAFLLLGLSPFGWAQIPTLRNFTPLDYEGGTQNWSINVLDDNIMAIANNIGLLFYDGDKWQSYPVSNYSSVRSVFYERKTHRIFVGASDEFGYFEVNPHTFELEYFSLSTKLPTKNRLFGEIWKIFQLPQGDILFQGREYLFVYGKDGSLRTINLKYPVQDASLVNGKVYISSKEAYYIFDQGKLTPLPGMESLVGKLVHGVVPYGDKLMFVTVNDGLFLYEGQKVTPLELDISPLLKENHVYCVAYNNRYLGFGTIKNGLIVKDLKSGINYYSNSNTGLQNNTVLSIFFDDFENIWLGLDTGISYVMLETPYQTLLGSNNTIGTGYASVVYGGKMFLGTNQGLFSIPYPLQNTIVPPKVETIHGVLGQIWCLQEIDGVLLCGANEGAYQVNGGQASRIEGLGGTWNFRPLKGHPGYVLTCDYDGMAILKKEGGHYRLLNRLSNFHESSGAFEQDDDGSIWMSHWHKGVYHFTLSDDLKSAINIELFHKGNGLLVDDNNLICKIEGKVYVSSVDGFWKYDPAKRKLEKCKWLDNCFNTFGISLRIIEAPDGSLIAHKADYMAVAHRHHNGTFQSQRVGFTNMVHQLQMGLGHLGFLEGQRVILNTNDGFYLMNPKANEPVKAGKVMIRHIYSTNKGDSLVYAWYPGAEMEVTLPHGLNSIRLEYVVPEYRGEMSVEYSCFLENYDSNAGEMSRVTTKEYTKLAKGKYIFHVKARNLVDGTESETKILIRILPAWYETWWAYLFYMILLAGGLWLLAKYMRRKTDKKLERLKEEKERQLREQQVHFQLQEEKKEKELVKLRSEQLEVELKHKSSELADSAMNLVRKNDMLQAIDQNMEELSESVRSNSPQSKVVKKIVEIRKDIKMHMNDDGNWEKFEENFNLVYDNFTQKLMAEYPLLKKSDLKLCVYLRMGLSSKEMASLLNTGVRSIETARYRLRKKLGVGTGSNLSDFIQSLEAGEDTDPS